MQKGGVKALLRLLTKSDNPHAQRFAGIALANCAAAGNTFALLVTSITSEFFQNKAFNAPRMISEKIGRSGMLVPLIEYILNDRSDMQGRGFCCQAIGNLAAEHVVHSELVQSKGM